MHPLIIPAAIVALGIWAFSEATKSPPQIGGIKPENHIKDKIIYYKVKDDSSNIKRQISRNLNQIIANCNSFKIGKTGRKDRGKGHNDFDNLIWLCGSRKAEYIRDLEIHYIEKHFDHPKNRNSNKGSAGKMNPDSREFFLYVITT